MRLLTSFLQISFFVLLSTSAVAQTNVTVKGLIREKVNGPGKQGVTISLNKVTNNVGVTNEDGRFTLTVPIGSTLIFSHTGFQNITKVITSKNENLVLALSAKDNTMNELVVQGFKTRSRETTTGSSTIISGKALQDVPVSNFTELLQGKVAGLNVQNNTGSPGASGTINLRGISSTQVSSDGFLTPTSPLFVIDGVPVDLNSNYNYGFQSSGPSISPLALIPPEDIEKIEVLRDAAATSLYGSRGAYGVIIVTTKRGNSKIPIVQYTSSFFINSPPKLREVIGGKEERAIRRNTILNYDTSSNQNNALALISSIPALADSLNPYWNNSTNWQKYYFRPTYNQTHNVQVLGGDDKFNYKTNLNYYQEDGIIANTGFKRYSLSMNALYQPTTAFKMVMSLTGSLGERKNGSGVGILQTGLASSANTSSLAPPPSLFSANNAALASSTVTNNNKSANIATSLEMQYLIVKGIRLINILSYSVNSGTSDAFTPSYLNADSSKAYNYNDKSYTLYDRSTITFDKSFNNVHNFSGYVFNEINSYGFKANAIQLIQTANDQIQGPLGYNYQASRGGTLNNTQDTRQHGYGGAFSYNYKQKYVVDFTYRLDGLSTNGPTKGYTKNPSISARWNFNKENFFSDLSWLTYGSVRGSWGKNITPTGSIFDVYGKYIVGDLYNNNPTVAIDFTTVPNQNFLPTVQTQSNLGLEMGFFNNRISTTFETYYKSTDNQISLIPLANENAFANIQSNAISQVNYGVEWTVALRPFKPSNKFQWTLSVNGAYNKDVLTSLPDGLRNLQLNIADGNSNVPIIYRLGRNTFSNLLYDTKGVYANDAAVATGKASGLPQQLGANSGFYFKGGDPHWADINGDNVIDASDLVAVGNPIPRVTGGINSFMLYNGISLNINVSYTLSRDLLNQALAQMLQNYSDPVASTALLPIDQYNYWKPTSGGKATGEGSANATYPNPFDYRRAGTLQPFRSNQTLFMEDGSYWKINNITLGYNFDKKLIKQFGMTSLRLSATANNVYTFSHYKGPDPELVTALGRDNSNGYPRARSYAVNLAIQF